MRRNEDDWKQRQKKGVAIKEMVDVEFTAFDKGREGDERIECF